MRLRCGHCEESGGMTQALEHDITDSYTTIYYHENYCVLCGRYTASIFLTMYYRSAIHNKHGILLIGEDHQKITMTEYVRKLAKRGSTE